MTKSKEDDLLVKESEHSEHAHLIEPVASSILTKDHTDLIHYMANFGRQNQANPYGISPEVRLTGVEKHPSATRVSSGSISSTYVLQNPDSWSLIGYKSDGQPKPKRDHVDKKMEEIAVVNGSISLIDWLQQKLSETAWIYDSSAKSIPRYVLAMLLENDDEKVRLANQFICSIEPYSMKTRPIRRDPSILPFGGFREMLGLTQGNFETEFDDFTITDWTRMYCLAQRNPHIRLDQATKDYILHRLLKFEGTQYVSAIPNTNSAVYIAAASRVGYPVTKDGIQNSENHLLMINGSAYIKNQLVSPGLNTGSSLEKGLCAHLSKLYDEGLSEFNSIPYAGYTVDALINLHDFAEDPVKGLATRLLDKIAYEYVIHATNDGKHFRPFARHIKKVKEKDFIVDDSVRPFMMAWLEKDLSFYRHPSKSRNSSFAFTALTSTYRPPEYVYELAQNAEKGYLSLTAQPHGNVEISYKNSYQETDSSGELETRQYLLSGGGLREEENVALNLVNSSSINIAGEASRTDAKINAQRYTGEVISRNLVLIIDGVEGSHTLSDSFFIGTSDALSKGPGIESRGRNNTGIYFDTMLGSSNVQIPTRFQGHGIKPEEPDGNASGWTLYEISPGLKVAVFDAEMTVEKKAKGFVGSFLGQVTRKPTQLGAVLVLPGAEFDAQTLINTIARENPSRHVFGLESFALAKFNPDEISGLKRLLPGHQKIQAIDSSGDDYKQLVFSNQEIEKIKTDLNATIEGQFLAESLVYGKTIKFPDECGSVMRGKRLHFNQESALDRWVMSGVDKNNWSDRDRKVYPVRLRGSKDAEFAPGWHGSVIQESPDSTVISHLEPESTHYTFLNGSTGLASEPQSSMKR